VDFGRNNGYNDGFSYDCWNGHQNLVKLNLSNDAVKKHLFDAVALWIDVVGVDGLRIDAADYMHVEFLKELSSFSKKRKRDFLLLGETIAGDYRRWVNQETLDSVTNYENYKSLWSSHNDANYFELAYSLNRQFGDKGMYRGLPLYLFADNHDVTRVASILKRREHLYPLACLLFTMPGVPSMYYGSELGIRGVKGKHDDDELRPELSIARLSANPPEPGLLPAIARLARIRGELRALRYGDYRQLFVSARQFVFAREHEGEVVIVCANSDSGRATIDCRVHDRYENLHLADVLNGGEEVTIGNGRLACRVWPCWGSILAGRRSID
jgi:cyclomaltodextrinase